MKIALLGYGKMGKVIEKIAVSRGHEVTLKIDKDSTPYDITSVDVAINFSTPESAVENIRIALENNIPVISGTTGWLSEMESINTLCAAKNGAFIYASNFSLGVNIFFELNKHLAKMMKNLSDYQVDIEEIHHTQKQDAPSGTAITLAEDVIQHSTHDSWGLAPLKDNNKLAITAKRIDSVPGTHTVNYSSEVDRISLTHTAHNREGFGLGAVVAAEWILGKTGVFTMNDVLNIG
ncbi:MAG: 4-hydroxy-tetrahydrodipicolinate reductase [Flavobacteriaceae bacterium]|jgi:4-hydroxy-tetrahydrodipicolinate reductase|nr:4-hydroxy-tetrahydrodipicolinate reductase [Flavobacteriaceae bacterium]MDA7727283.1 4-hydroxy-tetrahydrodipicolinate reductase [Flavobacteriaceae bacterium]MDA7848651.1 4-hydroxy-tetrahydrodipicolinate reductase [Flavobacteriaceae bacterium]MDB0004135.1 4-hydroxy-tetrahydrodipicolinate reductase [Flavobacteriaceae bacterium]MDB4178441.1 4-hydroxy-tetrahydrodipicolinate reductase [Flavobacteriaceae bacterium]|tara:strand:+ start:21805 stop:22509 length:705 start_codon:yes stop_codon:yes gene_type:complete